MKFLAAISLFFLAACASIPASTDTYTPTYSASALSSAIVVTPTPSPSRTPHAYRGRIAGFGDSIMLGAQPCLEPLGFTVNAVQGRTFREGMAALDAATEELPKRVVLGLGTNGAFNDEEFAAAMERLRGHEVFWVTIHLPDEERYSFANALNGTIARNIMAYPNAHLIDWDIIADEHLEWLYDDGIHLRPEACARYAEVINTGARRDLHG